MSALFQGVLLGASDGLQHFSLLCLLSWRREIQVSEILL